MTPHAFVMYCIVQRICLKSPSAVYSSAHQHLPTCCTCTVLSTSIFFFYYDKMTSLTRVRIYSFSYFVLLIKIKSKIVVYLPLMRPTLLELAGNGSANYFMTIIVK